MTIVSAYNEFRKRLSAIYDERESENIAEWIFEKVTGKKKWERRIVQQLNLSEGEINLLENYWDELKLHKPVQHVLQEAWFYKMKLFINENVLIPRPETEELVEWIVNDIKTESAKKALTHPKILDIGTGSGCISIALKTSIPGAEILAVDCSEKALEVAETNAALFSKELSFLKLDFLNEEEWKSLGSFDIIVSNPPYIPESEKSALDKNVAEFEPDIALFVPDQRPFIFYEKIALFGKSHLNDSGKVYVETHENFFAETGKTFEKLGYKTTIRKDIFGKQRMLKAE